MSDSFERPQDQANFDALKAQLSQVDAQLTARIDAAARTLKEAQRSETTRTRAEPGRVSETALPSLEKEVAAVNAQVVSYKELNALIAERIKLEERAATATRATAASSGSTVVGGAPAARAARTTQQSAATVVAAGASTSGAKSAASLAAEQERAARSAQLLAVGETGARTSIQEAAVAMAQYDTSMQRSGALSTAALESLGRGTITLRELGHQTAETIGKFGLWAGAAAAVYGVVGALSDVKSGAVAVSSTTTALARFLPKGQYNPERARQQIIEQGRATATPLGDVGDTATQFAKAFKTQSGVFTATHVALTAAKLDNISLADSYKYLTAIVQESGVSVSKLPAIFDQITAAQDKLGARVSVMLPAFSGSVGAVQSAGGDPSQLIGLEALTAKRTGFEGATIGNMYRQGAARYFNTAESRGVRARAGIDPNLGFTQALIEALKKAPGLTGVERNVLGNGFFGTRFGPRAAPLFRSSQAEVNDALNQTKAGANSGLANKQLANSMDQADNRLKKLKVDLQAVGAELIGSKLTTPFGLLLGLLDHVLTATAGLIHMWDQLPGPIKNAGSEIASVAAIIAGMRRFNVGGMMANSRFAPVRAVSPVFSKNPQKILAGNVEEAMGGLSGAIGSQLQSATVARMNASLKLAVAEKELAAMTEQGIVEGKAYDAAMARAAAAFDAQAAAIADMNAYKEMGSASSLAGFRAEMMAAGGGGGGIPGAPMVIPVAGAAGGTGGAITQKLAARQVALQAAASESQAAMSMTSRGMLVLNGAALKASGALSNLAGKGMMVAAAAFASFEMAKASVDATQKATRHGTNEIYDAKDRAAAAAGYNKVVGSGHLTVPIIGLKIPNAFGEIANLISGQDAAAKSELRNKLGYFHAQESGQDASNSSLARVNSLERAGNYAGALTTMRGDKALQTQNPALFQQLLKSVYNKFAGNSVTGGKGADPFAMWEQASQDLTNQLEPMAQAISNQAKVFGTGHGNVSSLSHGFAYSVEKYGKTGASDPKAMQALASFQQDISAAVDKQVSDLNNLANTTSSNKGSAGYYRQAIGSIDGDIAKVKQSFSQAEKLPGADIAKLEQAKNQLIGQILQKRAAEIQGLLDLISSQTDVKVSAIGGIGPMADLQRAEAQMTGDQTQLSDARKAGADAKTINGLVAKVQGQATTILQNKVSYLQAMSQAQIQYAQAGTADPIAQQQIAISGLQSLYNQLVAAGDKDKVQLLGLLGQIRSANAQKMADQISQEQAQSQTSLSQANIGQPQQVQLQNAVNSAQKQLAYLQSLPKNQVNPSTIIAAYGALYQAQGAMAQYVIQEGQSMIQATAALQGAQTFDPVAIAEAALEGAKKLLAYDTAHNLSPSQLKQDAAAVAQDGKAKLQARWQQQESTIQFLAQTYKITGAQEIERLQKLMANMKKAHASYTDIQQVAQELFNLEFGSSGNLNLNTGQLHLPSTYQVKSAILGGKLAGRRKTTAGLVADVKTDVKLTVNVHRDADVDKVWGALDKALGTSVQGLVQAAGLG